MTALPEPQIDIRRIGHEQQPVVVVDGFSHMVDELLERGRASRFLPGGAFYPGIRAPARPDLIERRRDLVITLLERVFGLRQEIVLEMLAYALVTTPRDRLGAMQAIPHYDQAGERVVAGMFYMLDRHSGGTAFYRHRRTGFETIRADREQAYQAALTQERRELGDPAPNYHYGDTDRFELIGEVEARPDRLALYRGCLLHSGVIPPDAPLSTDPAEGRLTMNMFFRGQ